MSDTTSPKTRRWGTLCCGGSPRGAEQAAHQDKGDERRRETRKTRTRLRT